MRALTFTKISSILLLAFFFMIACENSDPVSPDMADKAVKESTKDFKVLAIGDGAGLKKITSQSKWMTTEEGGHLWLFHVGEDTLADLFVFSYLEVLPNTMSEDAEIGLTVNDQEFEGLADIEFAPHGIQFSTPAQLTLYAKGLDLSGINPEDIKFFYDNEDTGVWEEMVHEYMYVNIELGIIYVRKAQLPHFSRYAIGLE